MLLNKEWLRYLWRFQCFNQTDLKTIQGEQMKILNPGLLNEGVGPDFLHATLLINNRQWHGHVVLYLGRSSDGASWYKHADHPAYDHVILHVVWKDDMVRLRRNGAAILLLYNRVDATLVARYQELMEQPAVIPCGSQLSTVPPSVMKEMLSSTLFERIYKKSNWILALLHRNVGDWEETCYQLLAYSFGFKANAEPFMALSRGLPWSLLKCYADNLFQLEAFLFGQAGLCPKQVANDAYIEGLLKEYDYLQQKHHGHFCFQVFNNKWYFTRLRPANFPTIRLAQFASLLHQIPCFFDTFITHEVTSFRRQFMVTQSDYWQTHYLPNKPTQCKIKGLGVASIDKILINAVAPFLVAYSTYKGSRSYAKRIVDLLVSLPPEHNHILKDWAKIGILPKNAFNAQGLIHLYRQYCQTKACLSCKIGDALLRKK